MNIQVNALEKEEITRVEKHKEEDKELRQVPFINLSCELNNS